MCWQRVRDQKHGRLEHGQNKHQPPSSSSGLPSYPEQIPGRSFSLHALFSPAKMGSTASCFLSPPPAPKRGPRPWFLSPAWRQRQQTAGLLWGSSSTCSRAVAGNDMFKPSMHSDDWHMRRHRRELVGVAFVGFTTRALTVPARS